LDPNAEPDDFPGLLTATLQWHRMFRDPTGSWSETIYVGTELQHETSQHVDILQTQEGPITCRWLFVAGNPFPFGVDVESGAGQDESRLLFEEWSTNGELPFPARIGVIIPQSGDIIWLNVHSAERRK